MNNDVNGLWTIEELGERVAEALQGSGYGGVTSGRVRDVPDLRTIRYYTTLGLLDRAAAMRGRTALYGSRHLNQLVAIKRLQARGLSLAEVQQKVAGLSDAALCRLAAAEPVVSTPRAESFWRIRPVEESHPDGPGAARPAARTVAVGHGLELSLEAARGLDEDDLRVIRMAAAPLIEILKLRGLIGIGPAEPRKGERR
jgi:DNA-binding transcriptional MerR regulator